MRTILIAMFVAAGIGFVGNSGASAAPASGAAIHDAAAVIEVVRGPIDRIDVPLNVTRSVSTRALFSDDRVERACRHERIRDVALGPQVHLGHHVGRRRLRVDPGARGSEPLAKQRAGRARGGHGKIKEIVAHGRSLEVTPVSDQLG